MGIAWFPGSPPTLPVPRDDRRKFSVYIDHTFCCRSSWNVGDSVVSLLA